MVYAWLPPPPRKPKLRGYVGAMEAIPGAVGGCFVLFSLPFFAAMFASGAPFWTHAAVSLFTLIGAGVASIGIVSAVRKRRLLVQGTATTGVVSHVGPSNTTINDVPVPEVTFEFDTPHGHRHVKRTMRDAPPVGAEVAILYDPADPSRAMIADPTSFV